MHDQLVAEAHTLYFSRDTAEFTIADLTNQLNGRKFELQAERKHSQCTSEQLKTTQATSSTQHGRQAVQDLKDKLSKAESELHRTEQRNTAQNRQLQQCQTKLAAIKKQGCTPPTNLRELEVVKGELLHLKEKSAAELAAVSGRLGMLQQESVHALHCYKASVQAHETTRRDLANAQSKQAALLARNRVLQRGRNEALATCAVHRTLVAAGTSWGTDDREKTIMMLRAELGAAGRVRASLEKELRRVWLRVHPADWAERRGKGARMEVCQQSASNVAAENEAGARENTYLWLLGGDDNVMSTEG